MTEEGDKDVDVQFQESVDGKRSTFNVTVQHSLPSEYPLLTVRPPSFFIHPNHSNIPPLSALLTHPTPSPSHFPCLSSPPLCLGVRALRVLPIPLLPLVVHLPSQSLLANSSQHVVHVACEGGGLPLLLYLGGVLIRGRGNRVRCDLKDLPFSSTGTQPQCSNCKERGLKCVFVTSPLSIPLSLDARPSDEFAEVKAVKLLRRGRRLQQVEYVPPPIISSTIFAHLFVSRAVYGKTIDEDGGLFTAPTLSPGIIPKLQPEFFSSPFFRRLHIQRQPFSLVHT